MNPPIFRAYHKLSRTFIKDGFLTTDNKFLVSAPNELPIPIEGVEIDFFTGKMAENGQPVYQHDEVEIATPNEFGSVTLGTGIIVYNADTMRYTVACDNVDHNQELPTKILRVIGHKHP